MKRLSLILSNFLILSNLILSIFLLFATNVFSNADEKIIIDSDLTFEEAILGTKAPQNIVNNLTIINVQYYSFDNKLHQGQLVIHKEIKNDIIELFDLIKNKKFPIEKVIPIVKYNWSDSASMADNNTSAFNYRNVSGTKNLSKHAFGKAIDINPVQNPYKSKSGILSPRNATYDKRKAGTLTSDNEIVKFLISRGWEWGGNYKSIKDWHHFAIK